MHKYLWQNVQEVVDKAAAMSISSRWVPMILLLNKKE